MISVKHVLGYTLLLFAMGCGGNGGNSRECDFERQSIVKTTSKYPGPSADFLFNVPPYAREFEDPDDPDLDFMKEDRTIELRKNHPADKFFNTVSKPTTISSQEAVSVHLAATMAMEDYLKGNPIPEVDEIGKKFWYPPEEHIVEKGSTVGCYEPVDRTLVMERTLPELYSPQFIGFMQEQVLRKFPTWRFEILGFSALWNDKDIEPLAIYHDAVATDAETSEHGKQDDFVRSWQQRNREVFDKSHGALIRQLRKIRQLLPALVNRLPDEHVLKICVADNSKGDAKSCTIWLLMQTDWPALKTISKEGLMEGLSKYVTFEGRISEVHRRGQPILKSIIVPVAERDQISLKYTTKDVQQWELIPGLKDGTEFVISVDKSEFITDEQLKADPSLQATLDLEMNRPKSISD